MQSLHCSSAPTQMFPATLLQWRAEAVGRPGPMRFLDALERNIFNIFYSSRKISTFLATFLFFSRSPNFAIRLLKFLTTFFLIIYPNFALFRISCQISRKFTNWMPPPSAASCPGNDIFLFSFCHLPTFILRKLALGCPPGWIPVAVAPSARHCSTGP